MKAIASCLLLSCLAASTWAKDTPADTAQIKRGEYLAIAADCAACHTAPGGKPFAGGLPMPIPMLGTIYTSNITPDAKTGIGKWTYEDFERAVRKGVDDDGDNLYPAMPYPSYAKINDADMRDLYAYFHYGVTAVQNDPPPSTIRWPLNMRWPLKLWNLVFLKSEPYIPRGDKTPTWNRGAYLMQGLAHCGTCHTPRGFAMQEKAMDERGKGYLAGSTLAGWTAFNITSDPVSGIGAWKPEQLVQYLRTGSVPGLAQAAGPMGEAVQHSFSRMTERDILAMAEYLRTVPAVSNNLERARQDWGKPATDVTVLRGKPIETTIDAARLYLGNCATCHQADGRGTPDGYYPPLLHNSTVGARDSGNLVQVIVHGIERKAGDRHIGMPAFGRELSDAQLAALTNYVTRQFGDPATPQMTAEGIAKRR
ncbi:cytochrome C [Ralstonia sp. A12]|uniref:cytochrome c n=1 Tax=Ralstonia sp. A12 TaxID=1217052 RepID=UPI000574616D|nr:cytochrome c [Ralstonia sp. A12]KHK56184.1 cytochrome C [Ralstonia sp. A12]